MSSFKKGAILELLFTLSQSLLAKLTGLLSRVHTHWSKTPTREINKIVTKEYYSKAYVDLPRHSELIQSDFLKGD